VGWFHACALALLATGCDQILGLRQLSTGGDAAGGDALSDGAGSADAIGSGTVTLVAVADTYIDSQFRGNNYGIAPLLSFGQSPGSGDTPLVAFDLSSIASTAAVASAHVDLYIASGNNSHQVAFYEVLVPWIEGGQDGASGVANWTQATKFIDWGAQGASGAGDRGTTVLASFVSGVAGPLRVDLNSFGVAAVARWIADPSTNHGILVGAAGYTAFQLASREDPDPSHRPQLVVVLN